jgi:hypothetical protein
VTRAVCIALDLAATLAPSVAAHGDGGARGYRSNVTAVEPPVAGLAARVLDFDDRLLVTNETGKTLVILGYDGEPYLRFTADGVFRNERSPATYLNQDRYGRLAVPAEASARAEPRWRRVARRPRWEWHDHRIHWMSTVDPRKVRDDPDRAHHVFDWRVPARIAGEAVAIRGTLDYEPPPASRFSWRWAVPFGLLVGVGAAVWLLRLRRGRAGPSAGSGS